MNLFIVALSIIGYLGKCQGDLDVTLAVFSGVPDPQWLINPKSLNYQTIQKLLSVAKTSQATYLPQQMPPKLGYKGFLVRENGQDQASLILGPETKELQQHLLQSIPNEKILSKSLQGQVAAVIDDGNVLPVSLQDLKKLKEQTEKRAFPNFQTMRAIWDSDLETVFKNNCYNYCNDKRTNTFAQPGRGSGFMYTQMTNDVIKQAAIRDGLTEVYPVNIRNIAISDPNYHVVALVVHPGVDFHWYRLEGNGLWSHKPGRTRITFVDGCGKPILDPRLATNAPGGPNYSFVCFMKTDKHTVNIQ